MSSDVKCKKETHPVQVEYAHGAVFQGLKITGVCFSKE